MASKLKEFDSILKTSFEEKNDTYVKEATKLAEQSLVK